jgi:hypothetical protein
MSAFPGGLQSRRALLAGGLGGLAALVVQAFTRPLPVAAADVVLGATNTTTTRTTIVNTAGAAFRGQGTSTGLDGRATSTTGTGVLGFSDQPAGFAVRALNNATSANAYGLFARTASPVGHAVHGLNTATSDQAVGVYGESGGASGVGVYGYVPTNVVGHGGYGVLGRTESPVSAGVKGISKGVGVVGQGGEQMGVWGFSDQSFGVLGDGFGPSPAGVVGRSAAGTGVAGTSGVGSMTFPETTGVFGRAGGVASTGVMGVSSDGIALRGETADGTALKVEATGAGRALEADGPVKFSTSGVGTIASGTANKQVTPGVDLGPQSKLIVTLNGNPGTGITLWRAVINGSTDTFTVFLTGPAAADTRFCWFVLS